tara:strand:- start:185 stop:412 length:228 start_codon:yes stop_codon:yes gene_type:complete
MRVSVEVYSKDIVATLEAYKKATEVGAINITLYSSEGGVTKKINYLNLTFQVEHKSEILDFLDDGPFSPDSNNLY